MKLTEFEKKTREVFHDIHDTQGKDKYIFNRLTSLLSTEYLKVDNDFFQNKVCLDAGCGSNANATFKMLSLGAQKVYAFDLDESIFKTAPNCLKDLEGKYDLRTGTVLNIDFPDNFFDFVHCSGVLHHSSDVFNGLEELARVTKRGGVLYFSCYGKGGLIRDITTAMRDKYSNDENFKKIIDGLDRTKILGFVQWCFSEMAKKGDELGLKIPFNILGKLIDKDLVLTIKDRIQAPAYHENSEEEFCEWLKNNNFTDIVRLTRYPKYDNVRRFLSPLYEQYDSEYARLLHGSGFVQIRATKK